MTSEENLLEAHVHDFLEANITSLLAAGAKVLERESVLPFGRIDLLCEDAKGDLVAVEVKRGVVGRDAVGQLLAYLGGLRERNPDRHVRGVLVGGYLDSAASAALNAVADVDFVSYEISFTLKTVYQGTKSKRTIEDTPRESAAGLNLKTKLRLFGPVAKFRGLGKLPVGMDPERAFWRMLEWVESHDYGWHVEGSRISSDGAQVLAAENAHGRTVSFALRVDSLEVSMSGLPRYVRVLVSSEKQDLLWMKA